MRGSFPLPLKYASHAIQVLIVCEDAFSLAGQQVEHPYEPDAHFEDARLASLFGLYAYGSSFQSIVGPFRSEDISDSRARLLCYLKCNCYALCVARN